MSAEACEPRPLSPDPPNRRVAAVAFCGVRLQPVFFGNLLRSAALDATGSLGRRIGVFEITPRCQLFLHGEKNQWLSRLAGHPASVGHCLGQTHIDNTPKDPAGAFGDGGGRGAGDLIRTTQNPFSAFW